MWLCEAVCHTCDFHFDLIIFIFFIKSEKFKPKYSVFLDTNDDKLTTTTTIHDEFWVNNHLHVNWTKNLFLTKRKRMLIENKAIAINNEYLIT